MPGLRRSAMKSLIDTADCRAISVMGVIQVALIVVGTLVVFGWSKFHGYEEGHPWFSESVHFIRRYGWGFLIIPVIWTAVALWLGNRDSPPWQESLFGVGSGLVMVALIALYSYAVFAGYRRPLLQVVPTSKDERRTDSMEGARADGEPAEGIPEKPN